jgi:xanthine dehydrogenase YagR molybdenum-binding subunit
MTIDMTKLFGLPVTRVDGVAKVTGAARYASDEPLANPAYAYLVTSTISRGRLTGLMLDRAKAVPGVLDILTHENVGSQVKPQLGPRGGPTTTTLESDRSGTMARLSPSS